MTSFRKFALMATAFLCLAATGNPIYAQGLDESEYQPLPTSYFDLKGHKVGVTTGSIQDIQLTELGFGKDVVKLSGVYDLFAAIESGSVDFILGDDTSFMSIDLKSRGLAQLFYSEPPTPYGFGLRKDDYDLIEELNGFLDEIKEDGTFDKIRDRWITSDISNVDMPEFHFNPDGRKLTIGAFSFVPFCFVRNLDWAGFEIEILYTFAERYNYKPEILNSEFASLIPALLSGKIDIISAGLSITEERSKSISFSTSYFNSYTVCIAKGNKYFPGYEAKTEKNFFKKISDDFESNFITENRWKLIMSGLWETIIITILSILLGTILGAGFCMLMFSKNAAVRKAIDAFNAFICGVPILVLLMVMFYVIFASSPISGRYVSIVAFAVAFASSVSGIFYTGINAIDKGQKEAGLAMGFTKYQTFRNFVLPQSLKQILPLYKGECVSLLKGTSVVGYIGIEDLTKVSDIIRSRTFDAFFSLIAISIIYFLLAWLLDILIDHIGKKA